MYGCKWSGKLVFIEGIMDRYKYMNIISENLNESANIIGVEEFIFMQDNDPKHKAKIVMEYFDENDIELMEWPAQSPDLNPIEHLWSIMKINLRENPAKNLMELKI